MNRSVQIRSKRIRLEPKALIGQGGEAEVYGIGKLDPNDPELALKIWYPPDHPQYAGNDADSLRNREAAKNRLTEYGAKLHRFPTGLPGRVVTPRDLAYVDGSRDVAGYTMAFLDGTEPLRSFSQKRFRDQAGVDAAGVLDIFIDLHSTVGALHRRGVVIGDFNPLNALVRGREAHLIDVDSMQFAGFLSRAYTERYVDPVICDPKAKHLTQKRPHSETTDWYAFALMLFESLLFVHPYGGVYEPKKKGDQVTLDARPLKRISVLNPEVVYPVKGVPLSWLPSQVRAFYDDLLTNDRRGEFPRELLEILKAHAEGRAVDLAKIPLTSALREVIRGDLNARKIWATTSGVVFDSGYHNGQVVLVVHKNGEFQRQDGSLVVRGDRSAQLTVKAHRDMTLMAMLGKLIVLNRRGELQSEHLVDSYQGRFPVLDSNGEHYYWLSGGQLYRDGPLGPFSIGNVLTNQTRVWVGRKFGFGFYRAGKGDTGFVFDAERSGVKDTTRLPPLEGELIDAACYFSERRVWFFATTRIRGRLVNRCTVIKVDGTVTSSVSAPEGDGSWLGELTGHAAARLTLSGAGERECLISATDHGLIIMAEDGGSIVQVGKLSGAEGLADANSNLMYVPGQGLIAASERDVWELKHPLLA